MKLRVEPCPCGQCGKFIVAPLFTCQCSSLSYDEANEVVRRWNLLEEGAVVDALETLIGLLRSAAYEAAIKELKQRIKEQNP